MTEPTDATRMLGMPIAQALSEQGQQDQTTLEQIAKQHAELVQQLKDAPKGYPAPQERDPNFSHFSGDPGAFLFWLQQAEQVRYAKKVTDDTAIRLAGLAMGNYAA